MRVSRHSFGQLGDRDVGLTTLGSAALEVRVLDYGATVQALLVPDRLGQRQDVVLGFERIEEYVACPSFIGSTVGRVANRIAHARFELVGQHYELEANDGPHHLHGGHGGWDKVLWRFDDASTSDDGKSTMLRLSHDSPAGDGRYPGRVQAQVEFRVTGIELEITMLGTADRPTLLNLAHHGYFNLGGPSRASVLDHELVLHADERTPGVVPDGTVVSVADTPFDFRSPKRLGRDLPQRNAGLPGYDDNFVVRGASDELRPVAVLADPVSGRTMEVRANQPGVQLYTSNYLDGTSSGKGRRFGQHSAVCLETQSFPNAVNVAEWAAQVILDPGVQYRHVQAFRFA